MAEYDDEHCLSAYSTLDWLRSEAADTQRKSSFVNLLDHAALPDVPSLESIPLTLDEFPEPPASTGTSENEIHLEELEPFTHSPTYLLIPVEGLNRAHTNLAEDKKHKYIVKKKQRKVFRHRCCYVRKAIAKTRLRHKGKFISQHQALELAHTRNN